MRDSNAESRVDVNRVGWEADCEHSGPAPFTHVSVHGSVNPWIPGPRWRGGAETATQMRGSPPTVTDHLRTSVKSGSAIRRP